MRVELLVTKLQRNFGISDAQMRAMGFFAKICTWGELKKFINALSRRRDVSVSKLRSIGFTTDDLQRLGMMETQKRATRTLPASFYATLAAIEENSKQNNNEDFELSL